MTDRVYPAGTSPPIPGAYYSVKDQPLPGPGPNAYRSAGRRRGRGPCCCCLLSLCSILTVIIVALGIAVLVFWLVVHPRLPKYDVNNVRVTGLTSTTTNSTANPNVQFNVEARNPNKHLSIYYDDIYFNARTDNNILIGSRTIPGFRQGHRNTTNIPVNLQSSLSASDETQLTTQARNSATNFPLYVDADVKVRIKVGSLKTGKMKIKVRCNLHVNLSTNRINDKKCRVRR